MVQEIMEVLALEAGAIAVDCTLGYGGHAQEILARISPGGRLLGLDADPIELPKTEARLRSLGYGPELLSAYRSNFAGLPQVLAKAGLPGADLILADLGVSSMQIDDPSRGFSTKQPGPLDMRMNPARGQSASAFLRGIDAAKLARLLEENSDEPHSEQLTAALAGKSFPTTLSLASAIRTELSRLSEEAIELSVRRVFQTLRITVNDEFSALDALLRQLPSCLNPGGRAAILTFHSGEDRRVKKSLAAGRDAGLYSQISGEVIRPGAAERNANPRSSSAKLRWARRSAVSR
jgi:16S rRNA (cytosine1402-N4)-methyltransferase